MANNPRPGRYAPVGFQQITVLTAAVGVTVPASGDGRANCALIHAETQNVRWRDDGTDPTTTVGQVLAAGSDMFYDGNLAALKFIETTPTAKLDITFYEETRAG